MKVIVHVYANVFDDDPIQSETFTGTYDEVQAAAYEYVNRPGVNCIGMQTLEIDPATDNVPE